jgi:hypothetical protein
MADEPEQVGWLALAITSGARHADPHLSDVACAALGEQRSWHEVRLHRQLESMEVPRPRNLASERVKLCNGYRHPPQAN